MPGQRVPGEVVRAFVDLLHEGDLRIEKTAGSEHPGDFAGNSLWADDMLEHCGCDGCVESRGRERQVVRVAPCIHVRGSIDIYGDYVRRPRDVKHANDIGALMATSDDEHSRALRIQ